MLLRRVAKDVTSSLLSWHNAMILMPQIFDATANENARYKRNELELNIFPKHKAVDVHVFHLNLTRTHERRKARLQKLVVLLSLIWMPSSCEYFRSFLINWSHKA